MSAANEFPLNPAPDTIVELDKGDGTTVVYRWDADNGAWKIVGKNGGTKEFITTIDVNTTADAPAKPAGFINLRTTDDIQYLINQKLVNWFFAEQIIENINRPPIIKPDEPTEHPELPGSPDLINGDVWVDSNDNIYIYINGEWVGIVTTDNFAADQLRQDNNINELTQYLQGLIDSGTGIEDIFVKKAGDTMTGPLAMEDSNIALQNGEIAFTRTGTNAELDDFNPDDKPHENPRFSTIKSTAPINADTGTYDFSKPYGLQIPIDSGNTFKHQFKITNRNGDIVTVSGGSGPVVDFGDNFGGNQTGYEPGSEGGVIIKGIPTPTVDNPEPTLAVNKDYVDTRDNFLQQEIIELEEEIEALAPSTERGAWRLNLAGSVGQPGQFTMYDGAFGAPDIGPIGKIKEVESLWFNELDSDNTPHGFAGVEEGDLLELFVDGSPEYGLWTVVGTPHYETAGPASFWVIDVDFQRTLEDDTSFGAGDLCRLKIFKAPEGGSASEFVRKSGDEMSGALKFETAQNDTEYDVQSGQARIVFENTNPDNGNKRTINLFQPGDTNALVTNGYLMSKQGVYTASYLYGWNSSTNATHNPRVYLSSSVGGLYYGSSSKKLTWGGAGVTIEKGRSDSSSGNGFIVKGKIHSSSWTQSGFTDSNGSLLESYHNANGQDAINYNGKITGSKNITTKEYVDSLMPQYKITKSNGNYYVS